MPPKKNLATIDNEMVNFYSHKGMKEFITEYDNPHFDSHQIKVPFRLGIIASSGGGKTQFLLNLISRMNDTFGHIFVVYKAPEPLYEFLQKQIGADRITFYTQLAKFPPLNDLPKDKQLLVVFDDCVTYAEKDQGIIKELYVRGRKIGRGISMAYLSQSFYKIPRLIRLQFNYLIILKLGSKRDLSMILNDCGLGIEKDELLFIYKDAVKQPFNFLKIDIDSSNQNKKFSHNFNDFYTIESDSESDEG